MINRRDIFDLILQMLLQATLYNFSTLEGVIIKVIFKKLLFQRNSWY